MSKRYQAFHDAQYGSLTLIQDTPFRLFDLPPELWSRICRLAVGVRDIEIRCSGRDNEQHPWEHECAITFDTLKALCIQPSITRVCKFVRAETLSTFDERSLSLSYEDCTLLPLFCFLRQVPNTLRHLVLSITVETQAREGQRPTGDMKSHGRMGFEVTNGVAGDRQGYQRSRVVSTRERSGAENLSGGR